MEGLLTKGNLKKKAVSYYSLFQIHKSWTPSKNKKWKVLVELMKNANILKGNCNKQKVYMTKDRKVIPRMGNMLNVFYLLVLLISNLFCPAI
jgi:hypothetical protein